jgi:hypothetical protein
MNSGVAQVSFLYMSIALAMITFSYEYRKFNYQWNTYNSNLNIIRRHEYIE